MPARVPVRHADIYGVVRDGGEIMNFGEALERVKSGKKIQREGWNGKNQFVELGSHVSYVRPNGEAVNANHEAMGNQVLVFYGTSGVQVGWLASQADMLAEDWRAADA